MRGMIKHHKLPKLVKIVFLVILNLEAAIAVFISIIPSTFLESL